MTKKNNYTKIKKKFLNHTEKNFIGKINSVRISWSFITVFFLIWLGGFLITASLFFDVSSDV